MVIELLPAITILIIYEEEFVFKVWNGRKDGYMSPEEWDDFFGKLNAKVMIEEGGGKDVKEGAN